MFILNFLGENNQGIHKSPVDIQSVSGQKQAPPNMSMAMPQTHSDGSVIIQDDSNDTHLIKKNAEFLKFHLRFSQVLKFHL